MFNDSSHWQEHLDSKFWTKLTFRGVPNPNPEGTTWRLQAEEIHLLPPDPQEGFPHSSACRQSIVELQIYQIFMLQGLKWMWKWSAKILLYIILIFFSNRVEIEQTYI